MLKIDIMLRFSQLIIMYRCFSFYRKAFHKKMFKYTGTGDSLILLNLLKFFMTHSRRDLKFNLFFTFLKVKQVITAKIVEAH